MSGHRLSFKAAYLIYLGFLAALVAAAALYIHSLLRQYEASQPERHVRDAISRLAADAAGEDFWDRYRLPQADPGRFEAGLDLEARYLALYAEEEMDFSLKNGPHGEDELLYTIKNGSFVLGEVKLKAAGPPVTKLAVFSLRDWTVESVTPVLEKRDYTLRVPSGFGVSVNGIPLAAGDGAQAGANEMEYTVSGVYLEPDFAITDQGGGLARYTIQDGRVMAEFYSYALTLPAALTVELDGRPHQGQALGDGRVRHDITQLTKPTVHISDDYGNTVGYEGDDGLPLTYMTITADDRYAVEVNGAPVPEKAVTRSPNPDYAHLADLVPGLPGLAAYQIAILQDGAEITVTDELGSPVPLEPGKTVHNLTQPRNGLDAVPADVAAQIDVLRLAQSWSLFMTNDLPFSRIAPYLISTSYQYQVAVSYATGVDITYTSVHTLLDPPFTDSAVTNFVWITDACFSVDIRFIKHMRVPGAGVVEDPMNDRFYFVYYDDTADSIHNPAWKLASMKEIVDDAGA